MSTPVAERNALSDLLDLGPLEARAGRPTEQLTDELMAFTGAGFFGTDDARAAAALQDVLGTDFVNEAFAKSNANDRELEARISAITADSLGALRVNMADLVGGYPKLDVNTKVAIARLYAGVAGGLATLGADALVPDAQLKRGVAGGLATLRTDTAKIPLTQIDDALIGGLNYQGTWNASTNTPLLGAGATKGHFYKVSTAGGTNLSGITDWKVGDNLYYNGAAWEKVDNTDQVTSVNGRIGAVIGLVEGTDTRLSDPRTPIDGSVTNAKVAAAAGIEKSKLAALALVDADLATNAHLPLTVPNAAGRPATARVGKILYQEDTKESFKNTGTEAAPVWSALGGGGGAATQIATLRRTANLTTTNNAWTPIPWDTETVDSPGWFDPANPNWLTLSAGKYQALISAAYASNATGARTVRILRVSGGSTVIEGEAPLVSASVDSFGRCMRPVIFEALAGDTLGGEAYQNSGVNLTLGNGGNSALPIPTLTVVKLP